MALARSRPPKNIEGGWKTKDKTLTAATSTPNHGSIGGQDGLVRGSVSMKNVKNVEIPNVTLICDAGSRPRKTASAAMAALSATTNGNTSRHRPRYSANKAVPTITVNP